MFPYLWHFDAGIPYCQDRYSVLSIKNQKVPIPPSLTLQVMVKPVLEYNVHGTLFAVLIQKSTLSISTINQTYELQPDVLAYHPAIGAILPCLFGDL